MESVSGPVEMIESITEYRMRNETYGSPLDKTNGWPTPFGSCHMSLKRPVSQMICDRLSLDLFYVACLAYLIEQRDELHGVCLGTLAAGQTESTVKHQKLIQYTPVDAVWIGHMCPVIRAVQAFTVPAWRENHQDWPTKPDMCSSQDGKKT